MARNDKYFERRLNYGQAVYLSRHWLPSQIRKNKELHIHIDLTPCVSSAVVIETATSTVDHTKWERNITKALKNIVCNDYGNMDSSLLLPALKESKESKGFLDLCAIELELKVCVIFCQTGDGDDATAPTTQTESKTVSKTITKKYIPEHVYIVGAAKKLEKKCSDLRNLLTHYHWRLSGRDLSFEEMVSTK